MLDYRDDVVTLSRVDIAPPAFPYEVPVVESNIYDPYPTHSSLNVLETDNPTVAS
jgi:hypothetical protein